MLNHKNPLLYKLIVALEQQSKKQKVQIWKRIAEELTAPTRQQRAVNLTRLSVYTKENDTVIVPGKVLGTGLVAHKLTVVAHQWSESAAEKIKHAGGSIRTIQEELEKNPKGSNLRIIG